MAAFLGNLRNVVIASFVLAILLVGVYCGTQGFDGMAFELFVLRWLHIVAGVMWIGLLWYFNFVQIPTVPKIEPAEHRAAVSKYIAPSALWWFRYGALATVVTGLLLASMNGYILQALTLRAGTVAIGIGMWLALIMAFNVWFIIWPNQQKALGLVEVKAEDKPAAARIAMLASRTNTMLSIPMLFCMVAQQNAGL